MTRRIKHLSAAVFVVAAFVAGNGGPIRGSGSCEQVEYACDINEDFPPFAGVSCNQAVTCWDVQQCGQDNGHVMLYCLEYGSYYGGPVAVFQLMF